MSVYPSAQEIKKYALLSKKLSEALYDQNEEGSQIALNYLYSRGITDNEINTFDIGYHPPNRDTFLWKKLFQGRIIFPVKDEFGDTVAFSGRMPCKKEELSEDIPHWLNSVFDKNYFFYGLNVAWPHILQSNSVILVEGQCDMISCFKHGFKNVVSLMGTNFAEQKLSKLLRFCDKFYIMLDGDKSGIKAANDIEKLFNSYRFAEEKFVRIRLDERNKDPDLLLKNYGPDGFRKVLEYFEKLKKEKLNIKCQKLSLDIFFHHITMSS